MLVGYARDSASDETLELQVRELNEVGCAKIFTEQRTAAPLGPGASLKGALDFLQDGDTLVLTQVAHVAVVRDVLHQVANNLADRRIKMQCVHRYPSARDDSSAPFQS